MEEQAKKSVLSDLYAIRASMSLISENDDKTRGEYKHIDRMKSKIEDYNNKINDLENERQNDLTPYKTQTVLDGLNEDKEKLLNEKSEYQNDYKRYLHKSKHAFRDEFGELDGQSIFTGIILLPIGIIGLLFLTFFAIHSKISYRIYARRDKKKYIPKIEKQIEEVDSKIAFFENKLNNGQIYLDGTDEEVKVINDNADAEIAEVVKEIDKYDNEIKEAYERISLMVKDSENIAKGAVEAYPLINKNDWANIDLLIFYFETGRADDVKEALQLVDKQRQTEQITNVIAMATQTICKTVTYSVQSLGQVMETSFGRLSVNIERLSGEMNQSVAKYTQDRLKSDEMTRALLQKINVSSDKLSEQMDRQMREVYNLP